MPRLLREGSILTARREEDAPKVFVYMMEQDDPRKCTASILARARLATPMRKLSDIRKDTIVLNPVSPQFLLPSDASGITRSGVMAVDCSWEKAEAIFMKRFRGANRKLPHLLAANPVNYARIGKLSTAEALSAALYIAGFRPHAERLLSPFSWGETFFTLNREILRAYSNARTDEDIAKAILNFGLESFGSFS